jgi:hypothetical protein
VEAGHRISFELRAIDRHVGVTEAIKLAAQGNDLGTDIADRWAIVLA